MQYSLESMRNVVRHYRKQHDQDPTCQKCRFVQFSEMPDSSDVPEGFEEMREIDAIVQPCAVHQLPRFPWLTDESETYAAEWLVTKGTTAGGPFQINFDKWRTHCENRFGLAATGSDYASNLECANA